GANNMDGPPQESVILQCLLYAVCPLLAVCVMPQTFAQYRTEGDNAFVVFNSFFYRYFAEKINNAQKSIFVLFGCKKWINAFNLIKGSSEEIGGMRECYF